MSTSPGVTYSVMSFPQATHSPPNWTLWAHGSSISQISPLRIVGKDRVSQAKAVLNLPWLGDDLALLDHPFLQSAVHIRSKAGWEVLLDVLGVPIAVHYLSSIFIEVGEQRLGLRDVVIRLHEELCERDGVVQGGRKFEAHEVGWWRD